MFRSGGLISNREMENCDHEQNPVKLPESRFEGTHKLRLSTRPCRLMLVLKKGVRDHRI